MRVKFIGCSKFTDKKNNVYLADVDGNGTAKNEKTGKEYRIVSRDESDTYFEIKAITKKKIYAQHGIEYKAGKIYNKEFGWINPLLVNGNEKIGIGCYHFSTLPGNFIYHMIINNKSYDIKGTCICNCAGCYAQTGNYRFSSVKKSLAIKTWLINNDLDFVYRAISAQLKADKIEFCRIHAAGDFNDDMRYAFMWLRIAKENPAVKIWTYTKIKRFETLFDGVQNANIVKSLIDGIGINYGHCDYILNTFNKLNAENKKVHICRCGIDKDQHCINCKGCSENEYVLFIEHSTDYKAEKDSNFETLKAVIENQDIYKARTA